MWVQPGVASAHCLDFIITLTGTGGHASMPHVATDPLLAAAHVVVALNNIVSRSISPMAKAVLSVCCIQAGTTTNVIPEEAVIKGTIRDFSEDVGKTLFRRLKEVVTGVRQH